MGNFLCYVGIVKVNKNKINKTNKNKNWGDKEVCIICKNKTNSFFILKEHKFRMCEFCQPLNVNTNTNSNN